MQLLQRVASLLKPNEQCVERLLQLGFTQRAMSLVVVTAQVAPPFIDYFATRRICRRSGQLCELNSQFVDSPYVGVERGFQRCLDADQRAGDCVNLLSVCLWPLGLEQRKPSFCVFPLLEFLQIQRFDGLGDVSKNLCEA